MTKDFFSSRLNLIPVRSRAAHYNAREQNKNKTTKAMKRQSIKNAFGDDMYVPSIPNADLDLSMPDIGLPDIDPDEEDYNLFDYDRTDNHTDTRYMRPRPTRMPAQCVRYDNADAMARDLKITTGMRIDCFISGSFIFGDFIEAFLKRNNCQATRMTIATLSMSEANVDSLELCMRLDYIKDLRLMVSDYFFGHERRTIIPYIYKHLDIDERFQLGVARIHTKTCHFHTLGGKKMVIHGSANLRSSQNVEQITIEEDPALYDFYDHTYDILFNEYSTINHSVTSRTSWDSFQKLLLSDRHNTK